LVHADTAHLFLVTPYSAAAIAGCRLLHQNCLVAAFAVLHACFHLFHRATSACDTRLARTCTTPLHRFGLHLHTSRVYTHHVHHWFTTRFCRTTTTGPFPVWLPRRAALSRTEHTLVVLVAPYYARLRSTFTHTRCVCLPFPAPSHLPTMDTFMVTHRSYAFDFTLLHTGCTVYTARLPVRGCHTLPHCGYTVAACTVAGFVYRLRTLPAGPGLLHTIFCAYWLPHRTARCVYATVSTGLQTRHVTFTARAATRFSRSHFYHVSYRPHRFTHWFAFLRLRTFATHHRRFTVIFLHTFAHATPRHAWFAFTLYSPYCVCGFHLRLFTHTYALSFVLCFCIRAMPMHTHTLPHPAFATVLCHAFSTFTFPHHIPLVPTYTYYRSRLRCSPFHFRWLPLAASVATAHTRLVYLSGLQVWDTFFTLRVLSHRATLMPLTIYRSCGFYFRSVLILRDLAFICLRVYRYHCTTWTAFLGCVTVLRPRRFTHRTVPYLHHYVTTHAGYAFTHGCRLRSHTLVYTALPFHTPHTLHSHTPTQVLPGHFGFLTLYRTVLVSCGLPPRLLHTTAISTAHTVAWTLTAPFCATLPDTRPTHAHALPRTPHARRFSPHGLPHGSYASTGSHIPTPLRSL